MLSVNVEQLKTIAKLIYDRDDVPGTVLTVVGESGIGKTESVLQFVKDLPNYEEPRVINVAHLNIEDMGMPSLTNGDNYIKFRFAEIFKVSDPNKKIIFVLDELNRPNNESVINFLMGAICERRLFGVKIPDNIRFMATLNPCTENYTETQDIFADIASRRRFNLVELRFDKDKFIEYSRYISINPDLIDFLLQNPTQILVQGKINCPRQWHRFNNDILNRKKWTADDKEEMKIASSLYMDSATCALWISFWEGSLEKFVQPEEILNDFDKAKPKLINHINEKRIDMIEASSSSLFDYVKNMDDITDDQLGFLMDYILLIPKPQAYVIIQQLIPGNDPSSDELEYPMINKVIKKVYETDEMNKLIISLLPDNS